MSFRALELGDRRVSVPKKSTAITSPLTTRASTPHDHTMRIPIEVRRRQWTIRAAVLVSTLFAGVGCGTESAPPGDVIFGNNDGSIQAKDTSTTDTSAVRDTSSPQDLGAAESTPRGDDSTAPDVIADSPAT